MFLLVILDLLLKILKILKAVTKDDVLRVYDKYIKDKPYVITSFVPKGKLELAAKDSEMASVVEEEIKENVDQGKLLILMSEIVKTPSSFDRSVEPATRRFSKIKYS